MKNADFALSFLSLCAIAVASAGCAEATRSCPSGWDRSSGRCAPTRDAGLATDPDATAGQIADAGAASTTADAGAGTDAGAMPDGALDAAAHGDGQTPDAVGDACDPAQAALRFGELLVNPDGADGGHEFIELIGPPGTTLAGARIEHVDGGSGEPYASYLVNGQLGDDGLFVLGGEAVDAADAALPAALQNGPDGLRLYGCDGSELDAVDYGDGTEVAVPSGSSLRSCGPEHVEPAERWVEQEPSPGTRSPRPDACSPCLAVPPGIVRINEVRYDPPGADGDGEAEFVELVADATVAAGALTLWLIEGRDGSAYADPIAVPPLPAGAYVVLGGAALPVRDGALPRSLQNGPDGLELRNCDGVRVDALGYGAVADGVAEGTPAPEARGTSLGRLLHAADTDDNARDFVELGRASPGAPNVP